MSDAPHWFTEALAAPRDEDAVDVESCPIHYFRWGDRRRPGVVLVHGGAAHAQWWTFLAPLLAHEYHVVALDLSGHGDSGRRETYPRELWAREVLAVAEHAGIAGPPVLVGHSMGGLVSIIAAAQHGDRLAGAVIVDSPVYRPDPEQRKDGSGRAFRYPSVYRDPDTAARRFRLVPDQPCENDFILEHVALHSVGKVDTGYTWKFDPVVFRRFEAHLIRESLMQVRGRVAFLRGEWSEVVTPDLQEYMLGLLGRPVPVVEIPQAYHHLILDQPLAFVAALRAILAAWDHPTRLGL